MADMLISNASSLISTPFKIPDRYENRTIIEQLKELDKKVNESRSINKQLEKKVNESEKKVKSINKQLEKKAEKLEKELEELKNKTLTSRNTNNIIV